MKKEYEALFTPLRIGNVEIRNRFAMAPMAMGQLDDHWAYKQDSTAIVLCMIRFC